MARTSARPPRELHLLVRGRRVRALAWGAAAQRGRVGGSAPRRAARLRAGVGVDLELVRAVRRIPRVPVRAVLDALVRDAPGAPRGQLGNPFATEASKLPQLVRAGVPGDPGGCAVRGRRVMRRLEQLQGGGKPARTAALVSGDAEAAALAELREALARTPREIPCKYLYDDRGSALFEQITRLPEYYPTRTEHALLVAQASAIVEAAGGARLSEMVELGSGAASKTVALLEAALRLGGTPRYVAVDISAHALARTRELLAQARPEIPVDEVLADYTQELALPAHGGPRLALFLGGTIGNDDDVDAVRLLSRVRGHLAPGDLLLLGPNLVTDPPTIYAAYN